MTSIAQALGIAFQPFAQEAFDRCLSLIRTMLMEAEAKQEPERDFGICALDLLTGMAEGLGPSFESLIPRSELLSLLFGCMRDPSDEIRQSAFALVGDLAKVCHQHLIGVLSSYMPVLIENLDTRSYSVCNNASWAIGEITIKSGGELMSPFVPAIMNKLIPIINNSEINYSLTENTAITIGRVAKVCPTVLAPGIGEFLHAWCVSLQEVKHPGEKEHAFEGLCLMIQQNPNVLLETREGAGSNHRHGCSNNTFEAFAWAVASW